MNHSSLTTVAATDYCCSERVAFTFSWKQTLFEKAERKFHVASEKDNYHEHTPGFYFILSSDEFVI